MGGAIQFPGGLLSPAVDQRLFKALGKNSDYAHCLLQFLPTFEHEAHHQVEDQQIGRYNSELAAVRQRFSATRTRR